MENSETREREIDLLIAAYLSGSASESEVIRLLEWIGENKDNLMYFNELKDAWVISGHLKSGSVYQAGSSWDKISEKIGKVEETHEKISWIKTTDTPQRFFLKAATWILLIGSGALITLLFTRTPSVKRSGNSEKTVEISTPLGARSKIRMPDSTVVWLNAGTIIRYSSDYGLKSRTVEMAGEAYFSVAHDEKHPFVVKCQGLNIRALGTKFNVKAYPEEKTISATLEEGRIDVRVEGTDNKSGGVLMNPRDKFIYNKETHESENGKETAVSKVSPGKSKETVKSQISLYSNVRTELYTSWKDARWIIYREPLNTLVPMLERRYNLKIIFEDKQLMGYKFSGTIENETVDQIMNALKLTAPLDYKISKDTIRLTLDTRSRDTFKRILTKTN